MNRPAGKIGRAEQHSRVSPAAQRGNAALLQTRKVALLCSRRCPGTVIVKTLDLALALRGTAVTVVGGFQSSMEKECLATLLRGKQPVIVCPARSIEGMRMPSAWRAAIDAGIMLVLSPFAAKHRRPTEALAAERNRFLASLADEVIVAHAAPGGQLERLCRQVAVSGKRLWTLDDPLNAPLVGLGARPLQPAPLPPDWCRS
jgi:hypothetical protein